MNLTERLRQISYRGIGMKLVSELSNVPLETIYNITRGRLKNLTEEREKALIETIVKIEELIQ